MNGLFQVKLIGQPKGSVIPSSELIIILIGILCPWDLNTRVLISFGLFQRWLMIWKVSWQGFIVLDCGVLD